MTTNRKSFSNDSRLVKMPLPKSVLLKDYLLDDLSSCSSNGFRSYPRRQCCTKVRYLIEIDLNKHMKLHPTRKKLVLKNKSKSRSKSSSVLHKASNAVVDVFKNFQLSKKGFWTKRTTDQNSKGIKLLDSFDKPIKRKDKIVSPVKNSVSAAVTSAETKANSNSNSNGNSNSSISSNSYFTVTSDSSTNVARNDVVEINMKTVNGDAKKERGEEKDQFSPVSVMDFPFEDDHDGEEEVTSPFRRSSIYVKGCKRKLMPKIQRAKNLAQLKPVRLEDRIMLSESKMHKSTIESSLKSQQDLVVDENQTEKKVNALLHLLKATMPSLDLSKSSVTESLLLGFFTDRVVEGNASNFAILQEAKDWINDQPKETFESEDYKLTYINEMEKGAKWLKYDTELQRGEVGVELEYEVFTSLVEEMLLDFYL